MYYIFTRLATTYTLVHAVKIYDTMVIDAGKLASPPVFSFCVFSRLPSTFSRQARRFCYSEREIDELEKIIFLFRVPLSHLIKKIGILVKFLHLPSTLPPSSMG